MTLPRIFASGVILAAVVVAVVWNCSQDPASFEGAGARRQAPPDAQDKPAGVSSIAKVPVPERLPSRDALEGQPALSPPSPGDLIRTDPPPLAALLGNARTKPDAEPGIVLDLLNAYRRLLGAFPAGENNRQWTNALLGANREKLPFIARDHPRLNKQGEIVDAWGTPFFFHMNSRTSIEVRSAGADQKLFTSDDVVAGTRSTSMQITESGEDRSLE